MLTRSAFPLYPHIYNNLSNEERKRTLLHNSVHGLWLYTAELATLGDNFFMLLRVSAWEYEKV